MEDSPRSSKRRKLDTPKRIASSPVVKSSAKRASGRLANRSTSNSNGVPECEPILKRVGRALKIGSNGTPAKRTALGDIDIYDDIEGALSVEPSPRPSRLRSNKVSREETASTSDELQEAATTPKRGRGRIKQVESASRSAFKTLVNGYKHGAMEEADVQDELAAEPPTPSRRGKVTRTPAVSARKVTAPRSSGRERAASPATEEEADEPAPSALNGSTGSKLRSTRKTAASARKEAQEEDTIATPSRSTKKRQLKEERTEVPETEDELGDRASPTRRKTPSTRRRANRADHTSNRDDEEVLDRPNIDEEDEAMDVDVDGNSVLESVLDPTEPSPFNKPTSAQKEALAQPTIYGKLPAGRELDLLKTIVLERISAKRPSPLVGLDAEYKTVHQLVEQTVTAGEGNSMLVIGARGSGKTALVNKVLSEVAKDNGGEYHVVRLNGFLHTDDKIALREIWRQLGKEMDIEEDGSGPGKNYADTLTTLLALLSHPSEQTGELTDQVAKAVIFVIDEFELFAQHPRQTLLYNLFDIAQSRKAPIAVLGLTTRIDVTNSLEKRVKSRFSHRYVHLSLAKTFTAFQEICRSCLTIEHEHLSVEERGILESGFKGTPAKKGEKGAKQDVLADWNANINVRHSPHLSPTILKSHTETLRNACFPHPTTRAALLPHQIRLRRAQLLLPPHRDPIHRHPLRTHQRPQRTRLQTLPYPTPLHPGSLPAHRRRAPRHHP
jgi:origin recognition complex subunit 4